MRRILTLVTLVVTVSAVALAQTQADRQRARIQNNLGWEDMRSEAWEKAVESFQNAIAITARMDARPWLAHTQHEYARMLLARHKPGDVESAHELLEVCVSAYRELGMDQWADVAAALELRPCL